MPRAIFDPRAPRALRSGGPDCQRSITIPEICIFFLPGTIGRHDACLLRRLPPSPVQCISGVCAAKRCGMRKRMQCGAAGCKFCRGIVPYRRRGSRVRAAARRAFGPFPRWKGPRRRQRGSRWQSAAINWKAHLTTYPPKWDNVRPISSKISILTD